MPVRQLDLGEDWNPCPTAFLEMGERRGNAGAEDHEPRAGGQTTGSLLQKLTGAGVWRLRDDGVREYRGSGGPAASAGRAKAVLDANRASKQWARADTAPMDGANAASVLLSEYLTHLLLKLQHAELDHGDAIRAAKAAALATRR